MVIELEIVIHYLNLEKMIFVYSQKRKRNYHQLNIHSVSNNIYKLICELAILRGITINQAVLGLLEHTHQPKFVFKSAKQALLFKSLLNRLSQCIDYNSQLINHLYKLITLYWQSKKFKTPTEQNSYILFLNDLKKANQHIDFISKYFNMWEHHALLNFNLLSTMHARLSSSYLRRICKLSNIDKAKHIKPLHHISLRIPIKIYKLIRTTCAEHRISYATFLYLSVVDLSHTPLVINISNNKNNDFNIISHTLDNLLQSLKHNQTFFNNLIVDFANQFFNRPQIEQHDNTQFLQHLDNILHTFNNQHINIQAQQIHTLIQNKKHKL